MTQEEIDNVARLFLTRRRHVLSSKARTFLMPARKLQQWKRRIAFSAEDELEGNGLIFLFMVVLDRIRSFSKRGSRQGLTCSF